MKDRCPDAETIARYLEGSLSDVERLQVELHAAECEDCASIIAEAGGEAEAVEPSEAFERTVGAAFRAARAPSRRRIVVRRPRGGAFPRGWLIAASATAAALLVAFAMLGRGPRERHARSEEARANRVVRAPEPGAEVAEELAQVLPAPAREEEGPTVAGREPPEEAAPELLAEAPPKERIEARAIAPKPEPELAVRAETETEEPVARVVRIRGLVMYARGEHGRWARAVAGVRFLSGDRLDTRTGMARIDLEGSTVHANSGTLLCVLKGTAGAGLVDLSRGEVFIDDSRGTTVKTVGGLISPIGTRFCVRAVGATAEVAVLDGRVLVENEAGKVTVGRGQATTASRGRKPTPPRPHRVGGKYGWVAALSPELAFAGRLAGPALYTICGPGLEATAVELPGVGRIPSLEGWSFRLGGPWTVGRAPEPQAGIDPRRWQPAGPDEYRRHAVVGEASWSDYEVAFALRVAPGSVRGEANSFSAILYQGAGEKELYRLGVWGLDRPVAKLRCVRGFGGGSTVDLPERITNEGRIQIRPGAWYRLRFAARTRPDRVELRGKLWPATSAEPAGWLFVAVDPSARRLRSGRAGVGLQSLRVEVAEFAVYRLTDW